MPIVFVHGVTVREERARSLAHQVQSKLSAQGVNMTLYPYFWGGSGVSLRWGGDSIPGISAEERLNQIEATNDAVPLPDLKQCLMVSPLLELNAWRETRSFGPIDHELASMNSRRAELEAATQDLIVKLNAQLQLVPATGVAGDLAILNEIVPACLEAAARTRSTIAVPDLLQVIARSLTASILSFLRPPAAEMDSPLSWETIYTPTLAAVEASLGGQAGLFGDLLKNSALSLALPLLRGNRGRFMPPIVRFMGDVFVYLSDRDKFLDGMEAVVTRALNENPGPLWIVAHSLGGVISFDYCSRYPVPIDKLITVGSQPGLFAEGDLLFKRHPVAEGEIHDERAAAALNEDGKRIVPENIAKWVNIYDLNDLLSFRCKPIFDRVTEFELTSDSPFPDSHSAYWDRDDTYRKIIES